MIIFYLARLWLRKVHGIKNLEKEKKFIFASNHGSYMEDFILPSVVSLYLKRHIHVYANDSFYKNFITRKVLVGAECIPIRVSKKNKQSKKVNQKAFKLALDYLKKDEIVGIFPEGHRSKDGKLMQARTGIAKLALTSKTKIIPVGSIGTFDIMPKGSKFPKLKRCELVIGKPIDLKKYYGKENNKKVLKEVTTLIMKNIAKLAKLEYKY
jgi:1-acyl-sn-glycerol-3-phosphate acyltransferase